MFATTFRPNPPPRSNGNNHREDVSMELLTIIFYMYTTLSNLMLHISSCVSISIDKFLCILSFSSTAHERHGRGHDRHLQYIGVQW